MAAWVRTSPSRSSVTSSLCTASCATCNQQSNTKRSTKPGQTALLHVCCYQGLGGKGEKPVVPWRAFARSTVPGAHTSRLRQASRWCGQRVHARCFNSPLHVWPMGRNTPPPHGGCGLQHSGRAWAGGDQKKLRAACRAHQDHNRSQHWLQQKTSGFHDDWFHEKLLQMETTRAAVAAVSAPGRMRQRVR